MWALLEMEGLLFLLERTGIRTIDEWKETHKISAEM
jgi:hypothetical protein